MKFPGYNSHSEYSFESAIRSTLRLCEIREYDSDSGRDENSLETLASLIETTYRSTAMLLDSLPGFEAAFLDMELRAFVIEACHMMDYEKSHKQVAFPDHMGWSGIKILRDSMHEKMFDAFKEDLEENNKISLYEYSLLSYGRPKRRMDWSQFTEENPIKDDEVTVIKVITADKKCANNKSSCSSKNKNVMHGNTNVTQEPNCDEMIEIIDETKTSEINNSDKIERKTQEIHAPYTPTHDIQSEEVQN
jgi:hypothetical protein